MYRAARDGHGWMEAAAWHRRSPKKPSTNTTSTRLSAPPRCAIAKPSRSNSSTPPASVPSSSTSTTASRSIANRYNGWNWENIRNDHSYGTESNPKIWVMREFVNSEANHLGMPLPKGRVRFYRRNDDGQVEFTGENMIDHTPHDETVRIYTGNAFDLTGERRRTNYTVEIEQKQLPPRVFEIKVRNHKKEPVEVRVVEHLYRWPELGDQRQVRRLPEERQPDHRVPRHHRPRRRKGDHLHRALHLVKPTVPGRESFRPLPAHRYPDHTRRLPVCDTKFCGLLVLRSNILSCGSITNSFSRWQVLHVEGLLRPSF